MKMTNPRIALTILSLAASCGLVLAIHTGQARSGAAAIASNKGTRGSSGAQWHWQNPLPQGNNLRGASFVDANTGTIVGDAGIILQTTNGGEQWNSQPTVTFNYLNGVSFTDANTGTAVGYENPDGMILRTTDGGNSWVRQNSGIGDPFAGLNFFGVHFVNSNIGTLVGQEGIILRTTDGGNNWAQQTAETTDWLYAVHFSDENHGTAVGFLEGKIVSTTDGGQNWSVQSSAATGLLGVHFTDANTGTVVGNDGAILRTTDGG